MDLNDFTQSKYLAGKDVPLTGLTLTIAGFDIAQLQDGTSKPAMRFLQAGIKPMLLNRTNRDFLVISFGTSQTEALIGQRVGVFFDLTVKGPTGAKVGGLRLRAAGAIGTAPGVTPNFEPGHQPNPATVAANAPVYDELNPPPFQGEWQ